MKSDIKKDSKIKSNTVAHIINGRWNNFFVKDSFTGELLSVIRPPSGFMIKSIAAGTTYLDLHPDDDIEIHDFNGPDGPVVIKQKNNNRKHVRNYKAGELYSDGVRIYENQSGSDINVIVLNPSDLQKLCVQLTDVVKGEIVNVHAGSLFEQNSAQMAKSLWLYKNSKSSVEHMYAETVARYNKPLCALLNAGQVLDALQSDTDDKLIAAMDGIIGDTALSIPGGYHIRGDGWNFFVSKTEGMSYQIQEIHYENPIYSDAKPRVVTTDTVTISQLREMIQLLIDDYYAPKDMVPSLDVLLDHIAVTKMAQHQDKITSPLWSYMRTKTNHAW